MIQSNYTEDRAELGSKKTSANKKQRRSLKKDCDTHYRKLVLVVPDISAIPQHTQIHGTLLKDFTFPTLAELCPSIWLNIESVLRAKADVHIWAHH